LASISHPLSQEQTMRIVVVGCGRIGAQLANRLYRAGHQVVVIDIVASAFENLDPDFRGRTLEGDVLAQDMLRRAGIEQTEGLAAMTSSDTLNAVIAHLARTLYHIPNVVVRNYDPRWQCVYETFGIQSVAPSQWGAQRMEELLSDASLITVFSAGNGEVEIYEFTVPDVWNGRSVEDLISRGGCACVALSRAGKAVLPSPDMTVETGDVLHLSATFEGIEALRRQLAESRKSPEA
jgi:trk system potassium uptake protein TrkA